MEGGKFSLKKVTKKTSKILKSKPVKDAEKVTSKILKSKPGKAATIASLEALSVAQPELAVPAQIGVAAVAAAGRKSNSKPRKSNPWITHVKNVAVQHGISYKDALKIAKQTYKK